ncbi:MAG: hypothetical protein KAV00_02020 [Phycisphaerae bacterium]|nr:hypothetical protein [Phycisphaerae bacterium]
MALALETFVNFESGTFHELEATVDAPTIETTPAPPYEYETYVAKLWGPIGAGDKLYLPQIAAGNKYVIGFYVQFDIVGNPAAFTFFKWYGPEGAGTANWDFYITFKGSDTKLRLYDANGDYVTSDAGFFVTDTWHLVEILFTHGDPGDLILHVDGVEVFNISGGDFDGTS